MSFINKIKMTGLMDAVCQIQLRDNEFALFWLGQAGYLIKTPSGQLIAIDPCLSDFCENRAGLKRLMPTVCAPEDFWCDILFISHEHEDHFDVDLIEKMAEGRQFKKICGPVSIKPLVKELGIEEFYTCLEYGKKEQLLDMSITPVFSDHGPMTPNAMGFILDFKEIRLYYAGDTAYSPELIEKVLDIHPHIAIMPINGEFGNLDAKEAYNLAKQLESKVLIPCHYWMYARHGGLPLTLLKLQEENSYPKIVWLAQGEGWIVGPDLL